MDAKRRLIERVIPTSPHRVDREKGIIYDVKILGADSRNGYSYSPQAIRDAAAMYEGVRAYLNHAREDAVQERKFEDMFGQFRSIKVSATEVRGDLHFLKSHSMAERVCEAAERFPRNFGLSHEAYWGEQSTTNGETVIESIVHIESVDIVTSPATNEGLFESQQPRSKMTIKNNGSGQSNQSDFKQQWSQFRRSREAFASNGVSYDGEPDPAEPTDQTNAGQTDADQSGEPMPPTDSDAAVLAQVTKIIGYPDMPDAEKLDALRKLLTNEPLMESHAGRRGPTQLATAVPIGSFASECEALKKRIASRY